MNDSRSNPFINYIKKIVKESIIRFIEELINVVQWPNSFSAGFDATKLVKGVRLSEQNQAIAGGAYPDHFVPVSESSVEEVDNKLTYLKPEKNGAELSFGVKIIVLTLQRVWEDMLPYILIYGRPQTNRESKIFINVVQDARTNACDSLEYMLFLNSAVDVVTYESIMIQESILNYMSVDVCYVINRQWCYNC